MTKAETFREQVLKMQEQVDNAELALQTARRDLILNCPHPINCMVMLEGHSDSFGWSAPIYLCTFCGLDTGALLPFEIDMRAQAKTLPERGRAVSSPNYMTWRHRLQPLIHVVLPKGLVH